MPTWKPLGGSAAVGDEGLWEWIVEEGQLSALCEQSSAINVLDSVKLLNSKCLLITIGLFPQTQVLCWGSNMR